MNNQDQRVVGSYPDADETKLAVRELISQGFRRDQLTIYTNEEKQAFFKDVENVQVAQPDVNDSNESNNTEDDDKNFWESIRDAFKVRDDAEFDDPNYIAEDDLLYNHREDLRNGRFVVVVDETDGKKVTRNTTDKNTDHTADPSLETLGTTAGFPNEGSVQGMGDGGQPPVDSRSDDGTPPELEDTAGLADEDTATKDRMRQTRREDLTD